MAEGQLAPSYLMDASDEEHARLIAIARRSADMVQQLCSIGRVGHGARVIDVGCGPIGALLDLAEIVGPTGTVVGLDSSEGAVVSARGILERQGLANVRVVHADINQGAADELIADGKFDAAHMRFFLVHQSDPVSTLRRVASLLGPGGRVMIFDMLEDPRYPRYDPPVPANERAWELLYASAHARGAAEQVSARLPQLCEAAGLRVTFAQGVFRMLTPARESLGATRVTLQGARRGIVAANLATESEIDELIATLSAAAEDTSRRVVGPFAVLCVAEVP